MRALALLAVSIAATAAVITPASATTVPHTTRAVIRPVSRTGQPAAGFTVKGEAQQTIDCGPPVEVSRVAVNADILECSPSAAYAVACYQSRVATYAYCLRDVWQPKLTRLRVGKRLPSTPATKNPSPMGLLLNDGTRCTIRDGGAWDRPAQHPNWYGYYSCTKNLAVWGGPRRDGINRSKPMWSVEVTGISGQGSMVRHQVVKAYYVGMTPKTG